MKSLTTLFSSLILSLALAGAAIAGETVNINTADAATIDRVLVNVGPAKAQAIVEFRQKNGPFRNPEDLLKVDGIGERVLEQNRGNIRLNGAGAAPAPAGKSSPKPASKPAAPAAGR